MPQNFGKNLKKLRLQKSLTQAELSASAENHKRYLQVVEAGEKIPSVLIAARLRKALGCMWEELTRGLTSQTP
jgi:transcriptional regulator with XRE-family HTH domain